jgi:hypothetical protein
MSFLDDRRDHYILDDEGEPVAVDLMTWAYWFGTIGQGRTVLRQWAARDAEVSTVFLSLDHNFMQNGPPVLWETLVFGGVFDGHMNRYTSRLDALTGHAAMLALVAIYRELPRRTKWALLKWASPYRDDHAWRLRPDEQRRIERVLRRIGWKE